MEPAFVSELVDWLHISISGQVEFPLHSPEMVDCPEVYIVYTLLLLIEPI